jgi:hypothetical protein
LCWTYILVAAWASFFSESDNRLKPGRAIFNLFSRSTQFLFWRQIQPMKNSFSIAKTFIGLLGTVYMSDCAGHNVIFACDSCFIQCIAVCATAF